jgi:hypothetical protein
VHLTEKEEIMNCTARFANRVAVAVVAVLLLVALVTPAVAQTTPVLIPNQTATPFGYNGFAGSSYPAVSASFSITSLVNVSNTVTATTASATGLAVGQSIAITGALPSGFNGVFPILTVSGNTLTYTQSATSGQTATTPGSLVGIAFGGYTSGASGGTNNSIQLNKPNGLAFDPTGSNLYVADAGNNVIKEINLTTGGIAATFFTGSAPTSTSCTPGASTSANCGYYKNFGGDGASASAATAKVNLYGSSGVNPLAIDRWGNIYFVDNYDHVRTIYAGATTAGGVANPLTAYLQNLYYATVASSTGTTLCSASAACSATSHYYAQGTAVTMTVNAGTQYAATPVAGNTYIVAGYYTAPNSTATGLGLTQDNLGITIGTHASGQPACASSGGCTLGQFPFLSQFASPTAVAVDYNGIIYVADGSTVMNLASVDIRAINITNAPITIGTVTIPAYSVGTILGGFNNSNACNYMLPGSASGTWATGGTPSYLGCPINTTYGYSNGTTTGTVYSPTTSSTPNGFGAQGTFNYYPPNSITVDSCGNVIVGLNGAANANTNRGALVTYEVASKAPSCTGTDPISNMIAGPGSITATAGNTYQLVSTYMRSTTGVPWQTVSKNFQYNTGQSISAAVYGIVNDSQGNLYLSTSTDQNILRIDAKTGQIAPIFGHGTSTLNPLTPEPSAVACTSGGSILTGTSSTDAFGAGCAMSDAIAETSGVGVSSLAIDSNDNLYVADGSLNVIREIYSGKSFGTSLVPLSSSQTLNLRVHYFANDAPYDHTTATNNFSISGTGFSLGSATCSNTNNKDSSYDCVVAVTFNPSSGSSTGTLTAKDTNSATTTFMLNGYSTVTGGTSSSTTTVTTTPLTTASYGASVTLTANVTSGATGTVAFTYGSGTSIGSCTLASSTCNLATTALPVGSDTITATYSGDSSYNGSSNTTSISISKVTPTVSWTPSATSQTYGTAIGTGVLNATVSSPAGSIAYTSNASVGTCGTTIDSTCVLNGGTYTLTATFTPTDTTDYNTATATTSYTVNAASQSITGFSPATSYTDGSGTVTLSATASSGLTVVYTVDVSSTATCTITSGTTLTISGSGTCVIDANQAGNSNYSAATQVQATINVSKASQTITGFAPPTTATYGSGTISLSATGGASGNSVTYSLVSGPGSVTGSTLTITGVGIIVVAADQAGNSNYSDATEVTASITVGKGSQTITFPQPSTPVSYGVSPISLSATGGASGSAVTFSVVSGPGSITGSTLTVTGVGTIVVAADQAGSSNYNAATEVTRSITVNQAATTTSVVSTAYNIVPGTSVTLTATVTAGASGTVTFKNGITTIGSASLVSGTASISTSTLPLGTDSITAVYGGDTNYAGSTSSPISISVAYLTPTVALSCTPTSVVPGYPVTCTATVSGSGATPTGSVSFAATSTGATQGTLGGSTLVNGVATYYGLIWVGTDVMTATYSGDANYGSVASNPVTLSNYANSGKLQFNWPYISWGQPVSYGASSGAWPVTLQNLTGQTVTPTIGIANSNFVISANNCGTLTQGASCTFNVTFTPTSGGSPSGTAITAALTATTATPSQDASINVTGIALSSALTFNWPFLNFTPTVSVGSSSSPWPVTMTNSSGTATTVNSISFDDASFVVSSDNCTGQPLAAFASCTFSVTFSPIAGDITHAGTNVISGKTLTVSGNSGAVTGTLSAGGWAAAALGFNWPFVTFQNQPIGSTGTNLWPVTVTNYSGSTISSVSYTFTGVTNYQSGAFTLTNTCSSLAPGASCTFYIAPSPVSGQATGDYSATLVVSGSGLSSPALSVSGKATEGGYSINWNQDQQAGVSTIDFGPQNTKNVTAGPWPITVYNNTGATHTLTITPSLGVFTYDSSSCTNVASGTSCVFNLYFTPTADQYYNGTLTVSDGTTSYTFNTWGGANK